MQSFKILALLIIFSVTIISGLYPFFKKRRSPSELHFPIAESLAAGVFLGAALIHMLGDASAQFYAAAVHYPLAFLLAGVMFLFLLLLEHVGQELMAHGDGHTHAHNAFAVLATFMLSVHAFLMGAALGLGQSMSLMLIIFFAIVAHKWAESFSLAVEINKSHFRFSTNLILFFVFSLMTPAGILLGASTGTFSASYPLMQPVFSALAAGTFLYLGTLHGLEKATLIRQCCDLKQFYFVILGFLIMAFVAIWV
ncbi:MAG: zinc transporter [Gammaproteobacteria bacterium RIFCSPHIGHO2_12_FULL_42_13]|nr:MAG: zinc transporter [Gammaproteobacteria bacterium RIFCSPHIGHO2_12_FULL_42_13]